MQRSGNRRAGKPSNAVSGNDRLRLAVTINIQKNFAASRILFDLQSQHGPVRIDEGLSDSLRGFEGFMESPFRFDRCDDVQALAAGGFDERMIAERFEMFFEFD